jgi:hypothetical protein
MKNGKMRIAWFGVGTLFVFGSLGCATTQVRTDHDPRADFSQYRTFVLKTGQVINEGIVDTRDTLTRERINSALKDELTGKGLQPVAHDPDLIVTYTAGARTLQELTTYWGGSYADPSMADVWTNEYRQGTLVIDFIDAKTNRLVWRSIARADNKDFRKTENIDKAVDKALQKYPAPGVAG